MNQDTLESATTHRQLLSNLTPAGFVRERRKMFLISEADVVLLDNLLLKLIQEGTADTEEANRAWRFREDAKEVNRLYWEISAEVRGLANKMAALEAKDKTLAAKFAQVIAQAYT